MVNQYLVGFKHFLFSPLFGGNDPNLTSIFFAWVETTNQILNEWMKTDPTRWLPGKSTFSSCCPYFLGGKKPPRCFFPKRRPADLAAAPTSPLACQVQGSRQGGFVWVVQWGQKSYGLFHHENLRVPEMPPYQDYQEIRPCWGMMNDHDPLIRVIFVSQHGVQSSLSAERCQILQQHQIASEAPSILQKSDGKKN